MLPPGVGAGVIPALGPIMLVVPAVEGVPGPVDAPPMRDCPSELDVGVPAVVCIVGLPALAVAPAIGFEAALSLPGCG